MSFSTGLEPVKTGFIYLLDANMAEKLVLQCQKVINANPVILGGLFPNGKCVGLGLPVLNR